MPTMLRVRFDEKLLDAILGVTKIFRMVSDMEHVLYAVLNSRLLAFCETASRSAVTLWSD